MSLWAIVAIVVAGIVGVAGIVIYHEVEVSNAFDRGKVEGVADTTRHMTAAIESQRANTLKDVETWAALNRPGLIAELKKRCVAACKGNAPCIASC